MPTIHTNPFTAQIESQRAFFDTNQTKDINFRIKNLQLFLQVLKDNESDLYEAIYQDFRKTKFEVFETELGLLYAEIKFAISNIKKWSAHQKVPTNLANFPATSYIIPEPLGGCLIIGAWNYPYLLTLHPVISALAAGNTVIAKPSELATHSSAIMAKIINANFNPAYFLIIQGGISETTDLLKLKFDKIFYTGSSTVGKIVYRAAAEHLTPVTLELGGKSPAIVLSDAKINVIAQRIVWGKFLNAGQSCVAPDYLLVDAKIKDELIIELQKQILKIHGNDPEQSEALSRIISPRHFKRLQALIEPDKVILGGQTNEQELYISPTLMNHVTFEDPIMKEEIFGPILPILTFTELDWAMQQVKSRPKPLALYIFTESKKLKNKILDTLSFGGGAINETMVHLSNHHLPFGGVGNSGTGNYHGKFGFDNFSHFKAIHEKPTWFEPNFKYPPYTNGKFKLLKKLF